jgi:hypothetical protein
LNILQRTTTHAGLLAAQNQLNSLFLEPACPGLDLESNPLHERQSADPLGIQGARIFHNNALPNPAEYSAQWAS